MTTCCASTWRSRRRFGGLEADALQPLRAAGLSELEILDAAAVAAFFNFSNRINSALGVPPNQEAFAAHRDSQAARAAPPHQPRARPAAALPALSHADPTGVSP